MTERAQQYGLEPQACPFIALADDRDRRLDEPDDRHRCYAEPTPQPRAEAHQRAYCLTPAFAACPIFLDWAARAAADPVATRRSAPSMSQLARPTDIEPARPVDPAARSWAAPPPWSGDTAQPRPRPASEQLAAFGDPIESMERDADLGAVPVDAVALAAAREIPAPYAASDVPEVADVPDASDVPDAGDLPGARGVPDAGDLPGAYEPPMSAGLGATDVPPFLADRPARIESIPSMPSTPMLPPPPPLSPPALPPVVPLMTPQASQRVQIGGVLPPSQAKLAPARPLDGPSWAGSRRQEAHPMLRTRLGFGGPVSIGAAVIGVVIVVLVGMLVVGFQGTGGGTVKPTPTRDPNASPTASPSPTPSPSPSPETYTVVSGDSLFNIAKDHGLTIDQIACANGITDPNVLQVGQVLIIPDDEYVCPGSSESPSATAPG